MAKSPSKATKKAQPKVKPATTGKSAKAAKPVSKLKLVVKTAPKKAAAKALAPAANKAVAKSAAKAKPTAVKAKATAKLAVPVKKITKTVATAKPVAKSSKPKSAAGKIPAEKSKAIKAVKVQAPAKAIAKKVAAKPVAKAVAVKVAAQKVASKVASAKKTVVTKPSVKVAVKPAAKALASKPVGTKVAEKAGKKTAPVKAEPVSKALVKTKGKVAPKVVEAAVPAPTALKMGKGVHASSKALARTLAQLPPPPPPPPMLPPEPPRRMVSPGALKAFEQAVKNFNRQNFVEAKALFENLEQKFPHDGELIGRAQVYLQACAKKIASQPAQERTVSPDEFYDQGVHALNNGDYQQAKLFFEKALQLNPNEPDFLYSLAATQVQTGALDSALELLRRAIDLKPRFRSQAFDDNDFAVLRENRQFQEMLGLTSPFERLEQRR